MADTSVREESMEMFLINDFEIIKKLLSHASFPSKTYVYQMPDKVDKYADVQVDSASSLMNTLLDYHREEEWRVTELVHTSDFQLKKQDNGSDIISINLYDKKNSQAYQVGLEDIHEAIVVPDLHSVTLLPKGKLVGNILPNMIIRFVGLVQHRFLKCLLVGQDDPEHEGQRILSLRFEPITIDTQSDNQDT